MVLNAFMVCQKISCDCQRWSSSKSRPIYIDWISFVSLRRFVFQNIRRSRFKFFSRQPVFIFACCLTARCLIARCVFQLSTKRTTNYQQTIFNVCVLALRYGANNLVTAALWSAILEAHNLISPSNRTDIIDRKKVQRQIAKLIDKAKSFSLQSIVTLITCTLTPKKFVGKLMGTPNKWSQQKNKICTCSSKVKPKNSFTQRSVPARTQKHQWQSSILLQVCFFNIK